MWSNVTIGLIFGIGFSAWVYNKIYRSTGGNVKNAVTVAAVGGLIGMLLVITLLGVLF